MKEAIKTKIEENPLMASVIFLLCVVLRTTILSSQNSVSFVSDIANFFVLLCCFLSFFLSLFLIRVPFQVASSILPMPLNEYKNTPAKWIISGLLVTLAILYCFICLLFFATTFSAAITSLTLIINR
ncbi:MAG: hypothetical protein CBC09_05705 [Cellvibrionales bacterium TMED49]|nr:MAG: hypothetical protein CBC09_05705 [Cellvibrionales bacterium TMED49]